jgi:hypothetical protein
MTNDPRTGAMSERERSLVDQWGKEFLRALNLEKQGRYGEAAEIYLNLVREKISTQILTSQLISTRQIDWFVDRLSVFFKNQNNSEEAIQLLKHYFSSSLPKECFGSNMTTNLKLEKRLASYQIKSAKDVEFVPWENSFGYSTARIPDWSIVLKLDWTRLKSDARVVKWFAAWKRCERKDPYMELTFESDELAQFLRASNLVGKSKWVNVCVSGTPIANRTDLSSVIHCFALWRPKEVPPLQHCYAVGDYGDNMFGCRLFTELKEKSLWWRYGKFEPTAKYTIEKEALVQKAEAYWHRYWFCPLARREKVDLGISLVPKDIDLQTEIGWEKSADGQSIVPISLDRYFPVPLSDNSVFMYNVCRPYIEAVSLVLNLNLPETLLFLLKKSHIYPGLRLSIDGLAGSFEEVVQLCHKLLQKMYMEYRYASPDSKPLGTTVSRLGQSESSSNDQDQ